MTTIKPAKKATVILRNFPRHLRDHFKAWCAKRGQTMKDAIIGFMRDVINKDH